MFMMSSPRSSSVFLLALVVGLALSIGSVEGKRPVPRPVPVRAPRLFNVGGTDNWAFGVNSASWAAKTGPFIASDTLTFVYPPFHNVMLFKDKRHYANCNFTEAKLVADEKQGGSPGFKFTLPEGKKTYFFGCSKGDAFSHCKAGLMKFGAHATVKPEP